MASQLRAFSLASDEHPQRSRHGRIRYCSLPTPEPFSFSPRFRPAARDGSTASMHANCRTRRGAVLSFAFFSPLFLPPPINKDQGRFSETMASVTSVPGEEGSRKAPGLTNTIRRGFVSFWSHACMTWFGKSFFSTGVEVLRTEYIHACGVHLCTFILRTFACMYVHTVSLHLSIRAGSSSRDGNSGPDSAGDENRLRPSPGPEAISHTPAARNED